MDCPLCGVEFTIKQWNTRHAPEGWQLVPVEHDLEMSVAHGEAWHSKERAYDDDDIQDVWQAMLAAAPKPEDV